MLSRRVTLAFVALGVGALADRPVTRVAGVAPWIQTTASPRTVRELPVQPQGAVVNAAGEQAFAAPWPQGVVLSAKTGSAADEGGSDVRWLVGHVRRADREWVFVSCVTGRNIDPMAAVDLPARGLREARVL